MSPFGRNILIIVVLALFIGGGVYFATWSNNKNLDEEKLPTGNTDLTEMEERNNITNQNTEEASVDSSGRKVFKSEEYSFEIRYPKEWLVREKKVREDNPWIAHFGFGEFYSSSPGGHPWNVLVYPLADDYAEQIEARIASINHPQSSLQRTIERESIEINGIPSEIVTASLITDEFHRVAKLVYIPVPATRYLYVLVEDADHDETKDFTKFYYSFVILK